MIQGSFEIQKVNYGKEFNITSLPTSVPLTSVPQGQNKNLADITEVLDNKPKSFKMRNCVMTLNNWTFEEYEYITKNSVESGIKYLIVAKELAPTTGTPHLQMYAEFTSPKTRDAIKKHFNTNRLYIEGRKGTATQASAYCMFSDYPINKVLNDYFIYGEISHQGQRTDWEQVKEELKKPEIMPVDVIDVFPHLIVNHNALTAYKYASIKPIQRENLDVFVIYGDAGAGKSHQAFEFDENLYSKPSGKWFDGYMGNKTVLFDDFGGRDDEISYTMFLKYLDKYPIRVPVKGGFVGFNPETIFITSNKHPKLWFDEGLTPALRRRITKIFRMELDDNNEVIVIDETDMFFGKKRNVKYQMIDFNNFKKSVAEGDS